MVIKVTVYSTKPDPMTCPACGYITDWLWDDDGWYLNGEWWFDPQTGRANEGYVCSHRCYIKRLKEIDCDMGPVT